MHDDDDDEFGAHPSTTRNVDMSELSYELAVPTTRTPDDRPIKPSES